MSWTKRWIDLTEELGDSARAARVVEKMRVEGLSREDAIHAVSEESLQEEIEASRAERAGALSFGGGPE